MVQRLAKFGEQTRQVARLVVRVQTAGVGQDPHIGALEFFRLFAQLCAGLRERLAVCALRRRSQRSWVDIGGSTA
jgi:hypothetical protein